MAAKPNRDADADAREDAADRREKEHDIREGVLDRWERELAARAVELDMSHEREEASRQFARQQRASDHDRRRNARVRDIAEYVVAHRLLPDTRAARPAPGQVRG